MNTLLVRAIFFVALLSATPSRNFAQAKSGTKPANKTRVAVASNTVDDSMVLVHGGTIQVGIDNKEIPRLQEVFSVDGPELFRDEVGKHTAHVADFYLDKYLVTNAQFKKFVETNPEWQPGSVPAQLDNGNYLKHWKTPGEPLAEANHPAVNVNWYAAVAYCRWAGKRLPSEAEWEYAARGGRDALFPWGNEPPDKSRANYGGSGLGTTSSVGAYPANGYGLFDMAGNAWEFTRDEWKLYSEISGGDGVAKKSELRDAQEFLQVKTRRVIRGGSFGGAPVNLWVDYRDSHPPNGSREFVGFRCAK
jgi:sulfatase modifying factor 1